MDSLGGTPLAHRGGGTVTTFGWIIMLASVGGSSGFFFWCVYRVLRPPDKSKKMQGFLHTELEIEEKEKRQNP